MNAIQNGLRFLTQAKAPDHFWRDFMLAPGQSDEWVTAYIGAMLVEMNGWQVQKLARQAWQRLLSRHTAQGWGYNQHTPRDADSTVWALRLAYGLGLYEETAVKIGLNALEKHIHPCGGVATYADEASIRQFTNGTAQASYAGWCQPCTCVTSASAHLPPFRNRNRRYLRQTQSDDGTWQSYWWESNLYATTQAVQILTEKDDACRVARALERCVQQLEPDGTVRTPSHPHGSPFLAACSLRALATHPHHQDSAHLLYQRLLAEQLADGSWPAGATLRVPPQHLLNPNRFQQWRRNGLIEGAVVTDTARLFTTATVLNALDKFEHKGF